VIYESDACSNPMGGSGQWEAGYESNAYVDHTDSSASRSAAGFAVQCGMGILIG
jgi:hypothetical protein